MWHTKRAAIRDHLIAPATIGSLLVFASLTASHTHSDGRGGRKGAWFDRCEQLLFEVVKEADHNCTVPVSLCAGRAPVQIGGNRYGRAFTTAVVPWVNVLEARTKEGKTLAVLFEHAAHPVLTINGGGLSADYPGHAIKRIHKELDAEAVPISVQGCGGNINANPVGFSVRSGQHKNAPQRHTMVCGLTNAYLGYIATDKGYALLARNPSAAGGCRDCAAARFRDSRSDMRFALGADTEAAIKRTIESLWRE